MRDVLRGVRSLAAASLIAMAPAAPALARASTVLTHFEIGPRAPAGSLVQAGDGVFYGVTSDGGTFSKGSVFILYRTAAGPWATYTLHSFNGLNGARPTQGLLLGQDGNFYGTTTEGGSLGAGTVFRISPFGGLTTLRSFAIVNGVAHRPAAPLTQSADGFIWGTTCPHSYATIGSTAKSTVFRMTMAGGFATIHESPQNNLCVTALVPADDGRLLGLTHRLVPFDSGFITAVIRLTRTGQLTELTSRFGNPARLFRGSAAVFYVLVDHGSSSLGIPANSGEALGFTVDGTFVLDAAIDAGNPETLVEVSPGVLYGTTRENTLGVETLFRVDPDGQVSAVKEWLSTDPGGPISAVIGAPRVSLIRGADGLLYGLSSDGGPATSGAAFTLDLSGNASTLWTFASGPFAPVGPLVESAGALIGTSCGGGARNRGTVFRVTFTGQTTAMASFGGAYGECPTSLVRGTDGNFYGNTFTGTVFRMTEAGVLTALYDLGPAAASRQSLDTLTVDASGNLWGNWFDAGGAFVYRLTPEGSFTRFPLLDGAGAVGPGVSIGPGGDLFGAVQLLDLADPQASSSQVFRMTPSGSLTPQFRFPAHHFAISRLIPASDGVLYGTTAARTAMGTIFRATPEGDVATLHTFTEAEGFTALADLAELPTGELAGVTFGSPGWRAGLDYNFGIVFAMSKAGVLRELHRFTWLDGANPYGPLLRASDGALYGNTTAGGLRGGGVIYRIPE